MFSRQKKAMRVAAITWDNIDEVKVVMSQLVVSIYTPATCPASHHYEASACALIAKAKRRGEERVTGE